jgi:ribosomal protein S8
MKMLKQLAMARVVSIINKEIIEMIRILGLSEDEINDFFKKIKNAQFVNESALSSFFSEGHNFSKKNKEFVLVMFNKIQDLMLLIFHKINKIDNNSDEKQKIN